MIPHSRSVDDTTQLDAIGARATRKQRGKKIKYVVHDVQSVLNWSDRVLHGSISNAPKRTRRQANRHATSRSSTLTRPKPEVFLNAPSKRAANNYTEHAPKPAIPLKASLRMDVPLRTQSETLSTARKAKIQLSAQPVASPNAESSPELPGNSPSAVDPTMPSYKDIQRRRHQREKYNTRRRVVKSTLFALVVGVLLALVLQGYAWYATGSVIVAPELVAFSALLVLGPPLFAMLIGFASLRAERRR